MKVALAFVFIIILLVSFSVLALEIQRKLPNSVSDLKQGDILAKISDSAIVNKDSLRANVDTDIGILTDFNEQTGEVIYTGKAQLYKNAKDITKYQDKEVFLVSDEDWHTVLPLVPLAVWNEGSEIKKYPLLIYHQEGDCIDADSIVHFSELYDPKRITVFGNAPEESTSIQDLVKNLDAASNAELKENLYVHAKNLINYLIYWNSLRAIVYSENNYKTALMASVYASLINAPLIIEGTEIDNKQLGSYIQSAKIKVICIGNPTSRACDYKYSLDEIRQEYLKNTNTDKVIFVNENDLNFDYYNKYCYNRIIFRSCELKPALSQCSARLTTNLKKLFDSTSLAAPILASAKHEIIIFTDAAPAYLDKGEYMVQGTISDKTTEVTKNIIETNNDLTDELSKFFKEGEKLYLTIMSSPPGIADSTAVDKENRRARDNYLDYLAKADVFGFNYPVKGLWGFNLIKDIEINPKDSLLYVVDSENKRIKVLDKDGNFKKVITPVSDSLKEPNSIAFDSSGNIYISDTKDNKIIVLNSQGTVLRKFGSSGSGDGQFSNPTGIAIDSSNNLYVADYGNQRIQKFDPKGNLVNSWKISMHAESYIEPGSIKMDPENSNNLYVLAGDSQPAILKYDLNGNRIPIYYDNVLGNVYAIKINFGPEYTYLNAPTDFAIDTEGNFLVMSNRKLIKLDKRGNIISSIGQYSRIGIFPGWFDEGEGIAIDNEGMIYASDKYRIQKFKEVKGYEYDFKIGRIYGLTISDVSSLIQNSIFYDELMNKNYNSDEYTSFVYLGFDHDDPKGFGTENPNAPYIRNSMTKAGYVSTCILRDSYPEYPECRHGLPTASDVNKKQLIIAAAHGMPSMMEGLGSSNLGQMDLAFMITKSCDINDFWWGDRNLFSTQAIRKGAIGFCGSVTPGGCEYMKGIKFMTGKERKDLGSFIKDPESDQTESIVIMLGDPTLKPKFKEVTWPT